MKPLIVKRKIVEWDSCFLSSDGGVHRFRFPDKTVAYGLMCMLLAAKRCAWLERQEKFVDVNVMAD